MNVFFKMGTSLWGWGVGLKCHFNAVYDISIIAPAEHNFERNTLVSWVTPESIILYSSSIIPQTLLVNQTKTNEAHLGDACRKS